MAILGTAIEITSIKYLIFLNGRYWVKTKLLIGFLCFGVASMATAESKKSERTLDNLKAAITGETTASAKYAAYAKKAREEKFDKIALLFEAASKAEAIHAKGETAVLEKMGAKMDSITLHFTVKTTKQNLEDAIKGESGEIATMYPDFIKKAKEEGNNDAVMHFSGAFEVEKMHKELYTAALNALNKKDMKLLPDNYSVCLTCGATFAGNGPEKCNICGVPQSEFLIVK